MSPRLDVWVVEDNDILRDTLEALLNDQTDLQCTLAVSSCEDFLAALDAGAAPDFVLMDIGLPGRSGIDGVVRTSSMSPATKVIILTVHAEDDKVFEALCAGASGYLLKPSSPEQILDALRAVQRGAAPINPHIARKMLGLFARLAPRKPSVHEYGLTPREKTILQGLVDGLTMEQIATDVGLSYHTIDNHLRNIYRKLHVHSRSVAVAKALREDLL
ncbi:MAG: response regulator transcription factor [Acidobacteriota bacterium]